MSGSGNGTARRELVKALMALPQVSRIARVSIEAGDVIVIEVPRKMSAAEVHDASQLLHRAFPQNRVLILDDGAKLKIGQTVL